MILPKWAAFDSADNLYLVVKNNVGITDDGQIEKIDPSGNLIKRWGSRAAETASSISRSV